MPRIVRMQCQSRDVKESVALQLNFNMPVFGGHVCSRAIAFISSFTNQALAKPN